MTLASYKTFHANVIRDSIMIVCITCFTAIFCGFVIFAVLGEFGGRVGVGKGDLELGGGVGKGRGLSTTPHPLATIS